MKEYRRKSELQKFGETVVFEHLSKLGHACAFLGDYFPCFDIEARTNGQAFIVSVKSRNHTTDKNEEKRDSYNLFYPKKRGVDPPMRSSKTAQTRTGTSSGWKNSRFGVPEKFTRDDVIAC